MRILLVEDSHDIAEPIMAKLKREGHKVTLTDNGHDGESFALAGEFDVIVLDINLPGQNGFEVLASVRRHKVATPVLVITARNQIADKVSLLDLGADDYLVKPFDLSELAARVRALARRGMGLSCSEIAVGQLPLQYAGNGRRNLGYRDCDT
jgi:two-component system response regulator TctD